MRKFVDPMPAGGAPIFTQELNGAISREIWAAMQAMMIALVDPTSGIIVHGGNITDVGGGNFDIAAGIAFINNGGIDNSNFIEFDSAVGLTSPFYINEKSEVVEQILFADAATKDFISVFDGQVLQSNPGGAVILIDATNLTHVYLKSFIVNSFDLASTDSTIAAINTLRASEVNSRPVFVGTVSSIGVLTETYSTSGTWTASKILTGIYEIKQNGSFLTQKTVMLTQNGATGAQNGGIHFKQDTSRVQTFDGGGSPADAGFTIVVYP